MTIPNKYRQVHVIGLEEYGEDVSKENHEQVNTLSTKNFLTTMGDHSYISTLHDVIDLLQFQYDGIYTVGTYFSRIC